MSALIHLAVLLVRDGRVLLVRPAPSAPWELLGTPFREGLTDIDEAMAYFLASRGIRVPGIADAFAQTLHLVRGDDLLVYNLYAPEEWSGDLREEPGSGAGWYAPDELTAIQMEPHIREAVLAHLGFAAPPADSGLIEQIHEGIGAAGGPHDADRRARGYDVLRTLSGGAQPEQAHAGLRARSSELADDIVDFALGEVWSTAPLDRKTRSLEVVAMLSALGRLGPLRSHIGGALNHGATPEQVVETLRMVAVYAGFPAALEAWTVMEAVFAERGIPRPGGSA